MFRKILFISSVALFVPIPTSHAEPPINSPVKTLPGQLSQKVFISGKCWVVTNFPHLSKHFPGTVNVTATIYCPGYPLTIETKLTRTIKGVTFSKKDRRQGVGKLTINIAMPCIWKSGPKNVYKAQSWFTNGDGEIYTHAGISQLKC